MRLQEVMTTEVVGIGPDEAASTAWSRMELKRAPLVHLARPDKRMAGRTMTANTRACIRSVGSELGAAGKNDIRRKLGRKPGKFAYSI